MPAESHVSELKVLRRKEPTLEDENEWPQFDVRDVEVRDYKGSLTSLFNATPDNPVTLTGTLVTKSEIERVPIVVRGITYFAFGVFEGGGFAIWAAGEAGWHNVQPAKTYQKTYDHMTQGLSLLYYLVEIYEGGQKLGSEELFKQYGKANRISPKDAAEKFYAHAPFLASRMAKSEEGIKWGHTSFYQHLRKVRPEAFGVRAPASPPKSTAAAAPTQTRAARSTAAPAQPKPALTQTRSAPSRPVSTAKPPAEPARASATRSQARDDKSRTQSADPRPKRTTRTTEPPQVPPTTSTTQASAPKKVGRPRKASSKSEPQAPLLSEMDKSRAREVWKYMQKKSNDALPDVAEMTIETFARFLHQDYVFEDEKEAQDFLKYLAPDLVGMMSIPRNRSYDPWTELPVYDELMEAKVPPRVKGRIAAMQLQKRSTPLPGLPDDSDPSDEDSAEESIIDKEEASRRKKETTRRRISGLRPKSGSKYSGKAAKRKGKEKVMQIEDDEEMLDADGGADEEAEEDAMEVDTPFKQKSMSDDEEDDGSDEEPEYPNKRFTRSRGDIDPELEDLEFAVQQARSTNLPVRRKPSIPQTNGHRSTSETRMGLISEPAPSTDANAPGDIWNCPHAGCVHKVYGASEYSSKELIREHLLDHKEKDRVDLVKDEENMTQLPVSHLLKRIREMAERAGGGQLRELEGGMMGVFPPPLKRKVY